MRLLLAAILALPAIAADEIPELSLVREVNLERAATLPNFVADEIVVRTHSHNAKRLDQQAPDWQPMDKIEAEIAVRSKGEFTRSNVRLNGQPWNKPFPIWNWGSGLRR